MVLVHVRNKGPSFRYVVLLCKFVDLIGQASCSQFCWLLSLSVGLKQRKTTRIQVLAEKVTVAHLVQKWCLIIPLW